MDLKKTYNKIARDWFNDHKGDNWWKLSVDIFLSRLKKGDRILDVGCGPGIASKYLNEKGFNVLGVDLSEDFVDIAKREVPDCEFKVVDITSSEDIDKLPQFDGIMAKAVFLHLKKDKTVGVIKNFSNKLKGGGYFYVAVKEKRDSMPDEKLVKENDYGYEYERFFSYYTLSDVENYFKECGLEIVHKEVDTPNNKTWWVIVIGRKI